jgi:hypothetical protein
LGGSPISIDSSNVMTDTTAAFNTAVWLRAFTSGGVYYDIPMDIKVCGFEEILNQIPIKKSFK